MEGYTRKRSQSVPILSHIEKVLDHREDLERRTSEKYSRFLETRSPGDTARPKVRLSSGGLIRNQKRRRSKTGMGNTPTGSPPNEQEHEPIPEQARPRAFTTSMTEDSLESTSPGTTISHSLLHVDEYPDRHEVHAGRERCKSLPLVTTREDVSMKEVSHSDIYYSKHTQDGCTVTTQQQTAIDAEFYSKEKSFHQRSSLSRSLQSDGVGDCREGQTTDLTNSSSIDSSNLDKFGSLITDFDKLAMIQFNRGEQDTEAEFFSDFGRRRKSSPSYLEQRNLSMENSRNFAEDFRTDLALQKNMKVKTQRSQSLPLTSSCFVGEVRVPLKDEYSNYTEDGEYGFRQPLDHCEKKNEQSRQAKKSRKTRSKSLPSNISLNLTKPVKQRSLQSHDRLRNVNANTRRMKSLPFIYQGFTEHELLRGSQITHTQPHCNSCSDSDEKSNKVSNERKQLYDSGSFKQKAQLERASSFPLCGTGGKQKQTANIQEQLNKAIDIFFSVGRRTRSKSLPNVLEGKSNLNYATAVEKRLERKIPVGAPTTEGSQVYDAVSSVGDGSLQSSSGEEQITNEVTNSDASSDCDELELQIPANTAYCNDLPSAARPRGFSIPSSFKMEKIPEEPNETENCEGVSHYAHEDTESATNYLFKDHLSTTIDCTALVGNSCVSEEGKVSLAEPYAVNERSSSQSTTEENQQPSSLEHNLEAFNKLVTTSFSRMRQLELARSSSCLHRAAAKGDLESIKLLVEGGNDVNALDESGWPVLHAAVTTGNFDCCEWLIDAGADLVGYTNFVIEEYRMLCRQVYQNY